MRFFSCCDQRDRRSRQPQPLTVVGTHVFGVCTCCFSHVAGAARIHGTYGAGLHHESRWSRRTLVSTPTYLSSIGFAGKVPQAEFGRCAGLSVLACQRGDRVEVLVERAIPSARPLQAVAEISTLGIDGPRCCPRSASKVCTSSARSSIVGDGYSTGIADSGGSWNSRRAISLLGVENRTSSRVIPATYTRRRSMLGRPDVRLAAIGEPHQRGLVDQPPLLTQPHASCLESGSLKAHHRARESPKISRSHGNPGAPRILCQTPTDVFSPRQPHAGSDRVEARWHIVGGHPESTNHPPRIKSCDSTTRAACRACAGLRATTGSSAPEPSNHMSRWVSDCDRTKGADCPRNG